MRRCGTFLRLLVVLGSTGCHAETAPRPAPPPHAWAPPPRAPWPSPPPAPMSSPPCAPEGSYACGADRATLLACRGGRFVVASTCRGARGCSEGAAVSCDASSAQPGDACDSAGASACGSDRRTLLRCANGVFVPESACRNACLAAAGRVLCQ